MVHRPSVVAALVIGATATVAVGLLLTAASHAAPAAHMGFLAVTAVPFGLALGGLAGRPVLFLPAALIAIGFSGMLWSAFPLLLVPGLLYGWNYLLHSWASHHRESRHRRKRRRTWAPTVLVVLIPTALTWLAGFFQTTNTRFRCMTTTHTATSTAGVCTNVPPTEQVIAGIALAAAAVLTGWALGTPSSSSGPEVRTPDPCSRPYPGFGSTV